MMKLEINSEKSYQDAMIEIYNLMNKGEFNLNKTELKKLKILSVAAEKYEGEILGVDFLSKQV